MPNEITVTRLRHFYVHGFRIQLGQKVVDIVQTRFTGGPNWHVYPNGFGEYNVGVATLKIPFAYRRAETLARRIVSGGAFTTEGK